MKKTWILGMIAALLGLPGLGGAAERVEETVVVTASRVAESQRTVPQSLTVIDSETLDKNQYDSLADLLQNYGFSIMSYGPNQTTSTITIRGFSSNISNPFESGVLLLVNGAPIATTNLSMIPMDGIKQIEILRGPGAVQYGSSAMGGVINIIPKQGEEEFHLSAEAGGGTWQAYRALGSLSGKLKFFDFAGAITFSGQEKNYTTGNGDLYPDTEATNKMNYLMNFGVNFNEENRLGAVILGANDWGLGRNDTLAAEQARGGIGDKLKHLNSSMDINYDGGYSPIGLSWKLRYFNAYEQTDFKNAYSDDSQLYITQEGGQGQVTWNWNFLTLTGGMDYTDSKYSSGYSPDYQQKDTAGFGMIKLSFLEEMITLTGGVRYDGYTFKVEGREKDLDNTTFSGGLAFNPWDWLTLRATIGESYKVPSGLAVVGYDGPNGVEGNSSLNPEKGFGWDAGMDIHWRGLNLGITYFSTDYRDKITTTYLPSGKSYYYNASGTTYINGLEGQISFDLGEFFEWDFTLRPYFYFTKMFTYENSDGERLYNIRDFTGAFGVNFNYPEWGTDLDVRFNYIGYQKELVFDSNYVSHEKREGGKTTMDIFLAQRIYEFEDGGKFTLKAEVRNVTNENYAYRYDYPMPGRSFYIGIRYDF